jgi:hypothetical protein
MHMLLEIIAIWLAFSFALSVITICYVTGR